MTNNLSALMRGLSSFFIYSGVQVIPALDIFVISHPKWLKFVLQAHFFNMFWQTKFQLSITCIYFQNYKAFSHKKITKKLNY